jgi:hypothetical protein
MAAEIAPGEEELAEFLSVIWYRTLYGGAPQARPERYMSLAFRLSPLVLRFFAGGLVVTSAAACALVVATQPVQIATALGYCAMGMGVFALTRSSAAVS